MKNIPISVLLIYMIYIKPSKIVKKTHITCLEFCRQALVDVMVGFAFGKVFLASLEAETSLILEPDESSTASLQGSI